MADLTSYKRDRELLVQAVSVAGKGTTFRGNECKCPFHDDRNASAGIFKDGDGLWRFKCQTASCGVSGDVFDIEAINTGESLENVLRRHSERVAGIQTPVPAHVKAYPTIQAMEAGYLDGHNGKWEYTNLTTGQPDMIVYRLQKADGGKRYIQASPRQGGWVTQGMEGAKPLYNRAGLVDAKIVLFVEGEKCVDLLQGIIPATTTPGGCGASKSGVFDFTPLIGKTVYLWPDNDLPDKNGESGGIEHMKRIATSLETLGIETHIVDIAKLDLPPKGDVEQFLATIEGGIPEKKRALWQAMQTAQPTGARHELLASIDEISRGERSCLRMPWHMVNELVRFATPSMVSILVGEPGAGKSFFLIECAVHWYEEGVPFAFYALEDEREFHMRRALAQYTGNANLSDVDWIRHNADEVRRITNENAVFIDKFGASLSGESSEAVTKDKMLEWINQRIAAGAKVIIVDPITMTKCRTEKRWIEDEELMDNVKRLARIHKVAVLLASHPAKDVAKPEDIRLGSVAGGAAIGRFAHKVCWLQHHINPVSNTIKVMGITHEEEHNRTLHILKSRDTRGQGMRIAMNFCGSNLRFIERGSIVAKVAQGKAGAVSSFTRKAQANVGFKQPVYQDIPPVYDEDEIDF